jgi:hypothetical protein
MIFVHRLPFKHVYEFLCVYCNHQKSAGGDQVLAQELHEAWHKLHNIAKHFTTESYFNVGLDSIKWPKKGVSSLAGQAEYTALHIWLMNHFELETDREDEGSQKPGPSKAAQDK